MHPVGLHHFGGPTQGIADLPGSVTNGIIRGASFERTIVPVGSSTSEEPGTSEDPETTTPTTKPSEPSESQGSSQSSDPDDSTNGSGPGSERTWKIIAAVLGATFIGGLIYAIARYLRLTP